MNINLIKEKIQGEEYDFLRGDRFKDNIMLLTVGGSYAYGTNVANSEHTSDVDIRGIYLNSPMEVLTMNCVGKPYEDKDTDSVIYPFKQMIDLLVNVNPNVIEMLGTKEEHIFKLSEEGKMLKDNVDLFLTQRVSNSFGGYAISQLRRLQNALARDSYAQVDKEKHILQSIKRQMCTFEDKYEVLTESGLNLYIDKSDKEDYETEIFIDMDLRGYPLRDIKSMLSEMSNIVKDYGKLNHRNNKKDDVHLNKHAMHLVRLFLMGTEILEGKGINTYRENDREFLLDIRNGKYSYNDIFEMVDEYKVRFEYAEKHSPLPKKVDRDKINELVYEINKKVIERSLQWV